MNYAYGKCPNCGGDPTTGGWNHSLSCPATRSNAVNGPWLPPPATVILSLRFADGHEISVGRAVQSEELCDDVVERRVYDMIREFLRAVRNAGVKAL
jgi:hypothetical protein